ncbi:MAG: IS982 family transposase [Bacteroidales bacterium]|nr:IS982 family transposase [Bacteroidales bacterium]
MQKKLHISQIFSNLVVEKTNTKISLMYNFIAKYGKILDICKHFSKKIVNEHGNIPRRGVVPRFSDIEVIALSITAEEMGFDSENRLFIELKNYKSAFQNLISRREYNDRRKKTKELCEQIRKQIASEIDNNESYFCIDSKPIDVCRIARAKRCKMGKNNYEKAPDFGYCSSQKKYYYGYKLHALCGLSGVIHSYDLTKASVHDLHYIKEIQPFYHDCTIIGDKGYLSKTVQLNLFESANILLEVPYRLNQKAYKPVYKPFARARKRIETLFSQLTDQFMIMRNYAKQTEGLFTRIVSKISALTIDQYMNFLNNKPIGRLKYALF